MLVAFLLLVSSPGSIELLEDVMIELLDVHNHAAHHLSCSDEGAPDHGHCSFCMAHPVITASLTLRVETPPPIERPLPALPAAVDSGPHGVTRRLLRPPIV